MSEAPKHPAGIICKFENGEISIRIEWADADTYIKLSDEIMAEVWAYLARDFVEALKAALPHLHDTDSRNQAMVEAAGERYYGLPALALAEAALSKAEGRG